MKKIQIALLVSILIFGLTYSCNDDDQQEEDVCTSTSTVYTTSVDSPATGRVNETIAIEVNFQVINGCGQFGRFIETENGNTRTVEIEADYIGCICTQDLPIRTVDYEFRTSSAGNYVLQFKSSPTEFIRVELAVD